jgi:hypothetical protein
MPHLKQGSKPDFLGLVYSGKVALSGGMLAAGSIVVVVVHSIGSSVVVIATSEHWVSTSGAVAIASEIEGTAFALTSMAGSSVVA